MLNRTRSGPGTRTRMRSGICIAAFTALTLASAAGQEKGAGSEQHANWLQAVVVSADRVHLSDLLAPGTEAGMREVAAGIDLGRSPEPGSLRAFSALQLQDAIGNKLTLDLPPQVIVGRRGWPIAQKQITAALSAAGLPLLPITLLSRPETRTRDAILRVTAELPGRASSLSLVRFECRDHSICAPFWGEIETATGWQQVSLARNSTTRNSFVQNSVSSLRHRAPLVAPSRPALLICDQPGMEIRLRVHPLKPGGLGERVKVMDPVTRRIFFAEVKAENVVESDLEEGR